ncbi:exopolysaccharide biosynthesis protein [Acidovorax sp. GBBC 3334]|uniref:exopolysaccharide biosynthesis protein n=1 Tax=Acidovorax sp. GBBC 3334 TaxID=2940496 RepID=UPI00230433C9|nr:exopolysaccharide biosynthesis protein [Acidovorax sp. GBBC 3334]MDA8456519.1 exopolysaccharide biosynthesis protein [Acidovorax sp. GBBC 3334]
MKRRTDPPTPLPAEPAAPATAKCSGPAAPGIAPRAPVPVRVVHAESLADILDQLEALAGQAGAVSVGDMVGAFGSRSYGPLLVVPALLELSPVGAVPGVPTALACTVVLFAAQMLFGRRHVWVPGFLARRSLGAARLVRAVRWLRPWAERADRWFHGRLCVLTGGAFVRIAAAGCIALACTVPPLELVPFASSAPMAAVAMFGLSVMARDGLLMLGAMALAGLAVALLFLVA